MSPHTSPSTPLERELHAQLNTLRDTMEPAPVDKYLRAATTTPQPPTLHRWAIPIAAAVLIAVVTSSVMLLAAPSRRHGAAPEDPRRPVSSAQASFPQPGGVLQSRAGRPSGPTMPLGGTTNLIGRAGYQRLELMIWGGATCRYEPTTVTATTSTTVSVRLSYVTHRACADALKAVTTLLSTPGIDTTRPTTVSVTFDPAPGNPARHYLAVLPPDNKAAVSVEGHLLVAGGPTAGSRPIAGEIFDSTLCNSPGEDCRPPLLLVATAADGSFSGSLPPGTYELTGKAPTIKGGTASCGPAVQITIEPNRITHADIVCQIK